MIAERETRCLRTSELRVDGDTTPKIVGYAARFNTWADIGGLFREQVAPGAFAKTNKEADVRALVNHDENQVLGRTKSGTLTLREDDKGLAVAIAPPDTQWARDLLVTMRRGDINQMSFGFQVVKQDADYDAGTRVLREVKLFDVSVVTYPAYPTTSAAVRSAFAEKRQAPAQFADLDKIVRRIKAGATLTGDELRTLAKHVPGLHVAPEPPTGWRALLGGTAKPSGGWRRLIN